MITAIKDLNIIPLSEIITRFPTSYILVKIVTENHTTGTETGIPLAYCDNEQELQAYKQRDPTVEGAEVFAGVNLIPSV